MLPFTVEQFYHVFETYNAAIWPAPLAAYALGLFALGFLVRPGTTADRVTAAVLAVMWLWTGFVYHWLHFVAINPAARLFAAAFVVQGLLFGHAGATGRLTFGRTGRAQVAVAKAFIAYALIVYPLVGMWLGHSYTALPLFGVTPCPVTIFTFGCLLLAKTPVPWWLLVIPVLWSLVGGSAAFLLRVPQDWVLLLAGVVAVALMRWEGAAGRAPDPAT